MQYTSEILGIQPDLKEKLPAFLARGFSGYFHKIDATCLPFNALTFPSCNVTIPDFDKIIPDQGKKRLGQVFTENIGINGNKKKFKNLDGNEMEIRTNPSFNTNKKNVVQALYQSDFLAYSSPIGTFQVGEIITNNSDARARIVSLVTGGLIISEINGTFTATEPIIGLSSGTTATLTTSSENLFHTITELVNPIPYGPHEVYFDSWYDTNLNPADSKKLPRLIWVNGYQDPSTKKGAIYSWTGGIAPIVAISGSTVSINPNKTWRSIGFTEDALGNAYIVVNGVSYQLTNTSELNTSTITLTSVTGINVGDIASAKIEIDEAPIPFDVCLENKGYTYYGNWNYKSLYQSNAFNRPATQVVTQYQAVNNDLYLPSNSIFTGTGSHVYKVEIDSVSPAVSEVIFNGFGADVLTVNTSGYTGGTTLNEYKLYITQPGGPLTPFGYSIYKNGSLASFGPLQDVSGTGFPLNDTVDGITFSIPTAVVGNLLPIGGPFTNYSGALSNGGAWTVRVKLAAADTFKWSIDGGAPVATGVVITGSPQLLNNGVYIQFVSQYDHAVGDYWNITVNQSISRAWTSFYYRLPIRAPGEGYIFPLPSNFWAMGNQEEQVYVNSSFGEWGIVTTQLSGDLQSESIKIEPLKQAGANKVLYPYLIGHLENMLVYVTIDHNLDYIGRLQLLERPQADNLSDPVKLDFLASSFVGGRIEYIGKRLYISSPQNGITHCYDNIKKYWQAPKRFNDVGILSIVGNDLICHSNTRNSSYTMFKGGGNGDDGETYTTIVRTPYTNVGNRWKSKSSSMSFTEGQMSGNPPIEHTVICDVNGCSGTYSHFLDPILCLPKDRSPLGSGSNGSHPLGSDMPEDSPYFQEIYPKYQKLLDYHFLAIQLSCTTSNHSYSYLSFGMNAMYNTSGNNDLTRKGSVLN